MPIVHFRIFVRSWRRLWLWRSWIYFTATHESDDVFVADWAARRLAVFCRRRGIAFEYRVHNNCSCSACS